MRKTYSYTGAGVIGALLGLLVWASTESLVLGILTFIGAGVVAFVIIRAIENAIYKGADAASDAIQKKIQGKRNGK